MANTQAKRDDNWQPVVQGEANDASRDTKSLLMDPTTGRALVDSSISSSALPTGAATSANQTTQIGQITDVTYVNTHTSNKELRTFQENHICTQNTTITPLGISGTFTGQWQDCLNYQEVNVSIVSDKDSAVNGLVFQWSADATNIGDTDVYSYYSASGGTNYTPNPAFRYFRVVYTNGTVAQTTFSLQTILRRSMTGGSFHRIDSTLKDDADARLNITIPKLKTAANTYVSQTATTAGNAKVSIEELETGISDNSKTQLKTSMYGKTGDTTFQVPRLDTSTHSIQTIEYEHHEIHAGSHFFYYDYDNDVDTAAPKYYRITTPNTTKWSHIQFILSSEGAGTWQLFENPTINAAGTTATVFNNDRNSLTAATLVVAFDATTTSDGTQIKVWRTGSGTTAPSRVGTESRSSVEVILKQSEDYVLKFTPDADNCKTKVEMLWYEHTNKTA